MKALLSLETQQFYLPKSYSWDPRTPNILPSIIKSLKENQPSSTWKLRANAKGFASTVPAATVKENANKKKKNSSKNNNSEDEEIPRMVFERMIASILVSVGGPFGHGSGVTALIWCIAKEQNLWDGPLGLLFLTTFKTSEASTLGIAYGTLSPSWDPETKGSFLGLEEVQHNWVEMWREENDGQWRLGLSSDGWINIRSLFLPVGVLNTAFNVQLFLFGQRGNSLCNIVFTIRPVNKHTSASFF